MKYKWIRKFKNIGGVPIEHTVCPKCGEMNDYVERLLELVNADALPDSSVEIINKRIGLEFTDNMVKAVTEKCLNIDLDPEIVLKQAIIIRRLQEELKFLADEKFGGDIRSYNLLPHRRL